MLQYYTHLSGELLNSAHEQEVSPSEVLHIYKINLTTPMTMNEHICKQHRGVL